MCCFDSRKHKVKMIEVKMIKSGSIILTLIILTYSFKLFEFLTGHSHDYVNVLGFNFTPFSSNLGLY